MLDFFSHRLCKLLPNIGPSYPSKDKLSVWELRPLSGLLLPLRVFCAPANNDVTRPRFAVAVDLNGLPGMRWPRQLRRRGGRRGAKHEHTSNQSTLLCKDYLSNYVRLHGGPTGFNSK